MPQPTAYNKSQDFAGVQSGNTLAPIPGIYFDIEFALVETTVDEICTNLALIQRDDGLLKNSSVHPDALNSTVVAMIGNWLPRGPWLTGTTYAVRDMVTSDNRLYVAVAGHVAGTFSADLVAGKWQLVSTPTAADAVSNTPAGSISAITVQGAIDELDAEKQPLDATLTALAAVTTAANKVIYATGPDVFAATDLTAFIRTLLDDTDAATARGTLGAVDKAGDTLTGELLAAADPTNAMGMATKQYVDTTVASLGTGDTRQTVMSGPVTSGGLPNFLPASATGLNLTAQNISASAPFVATAAQGWDTTGRRVDRLGASTTNLVWNGLTNSATNYLYVTVNANGTLTPGFTTTAPVYQWGGAPSATAGVFTFNIGEMKGYIGNGSTAVPSYAVLVGEAVTSGGSVASTVAYAYNGRYDSGYSGDLPATNTAAAKSHNLGVYPRMADFVIECTSTEGGYAVGDQIGLGSIHNFDGANIRLPALSRDTKSMSVISSAYIVVNKGTAVAASLTANKWKYKMIAERGW